MKKTYSENLIKFISIALTVIMTSALFCVAPITSKAADLGDNLVIKNTQAILSGIDTSSNTTDAKAKKLISSGAKVEIFESAAHTVPSRPTGYIGLYFWMTSKWGYTDSNGWLNGGKVYYSTGTSVSTSNSSISVTSLGSFTNGWGNAGYLYYGYIPSTTKSIGFYSHDFLAGSYNSTFSSGDTICCYGENNYQIKNLQNTQTAPSSVLVNNSGSATINLGSSVTLSASGSNTGSAKKGCYYSFYDATGTQVAVCNNSSVTGSVVWTPGAIGTYKIYCKADDGYIVTNLSAAYCTVTVQPNICTGPEFANGTSAKTLDVGDTYTNAATVNSSCTGSVSYESSDTGVASVDSNGKVTAKAVGIATITASCPEGSVSYTVTVSGKKRIYVGVTTAWTNNWSTGIKVYNSSNASTGNPIVCTLIGSTYKSNNTDLRLFYVDVPGSWDKLYIGNDSAWVFNHDYGAPIHGACYYIYNDGSDKGGSCNPTYISKLTIPSDAKEGDNVSVTSAVSKANTSSGNLTAGGTTYTVKYYFKDSSGNTVVQNTTGSVADLPTGTYKVTAVLTDGYIDMEYDNGDTITIKTAKDVNVTVPKPSNSTISFKYTNSSGVVTTVTAAGTYTVKNGTNIEYKVTPNQGYYVSSMTGVTANPSVPASGVITGTVNNLRDDLTITCTLSINPKVTIHSVDKNGNAITDGNAGVKAGSGSVSATCVQSFNYNTATATTFTAVINNDENYAFLGYYVSSTPTTAITTGQKTGYYVSSVSGNTLGIRNVTKNIDIYAIFVNLYKVTINYSNLDSISINGTAVTTNPYSVYLASGTAVNISAAADADHKITNSSWNITGSITSPELNNSTANFTVASSDITVTITPDVATYSGEGYWSKRLLTIDATDVIVDGPWFAAKFSKSSTGSSPVWVRFTEKAENEYVCVIPNGYTYVRLCRMGNKAVSFTDETENSINTTKAWNVTGYINLGATGDKKYKLGFVTGDTDALSVTP